MLGYGYEGSMAPVRWFFVMCLFPLSAGPAGRLVPAPFLAVPVAVSLFPSCPFLLPSSPPPPSLLTSAPPSGASTSRARAFAGCRASPPSLPLCAPKSDRPRSSARAEIDSGKHHVSPPPRVRVRTPIPPFPTAPKPLRASGRLRVGAVNHHGSRHRHALFCKRPLAAAGTPTADSRREARSDVAGADSPAGHERQPDALHCGSNAEHTRTGQNKAGQSKAGQSRGRLSLSDTPPPVAPRLDSTTRVPTPSGQPPSCLRSCPLWLPPPCGPHCCHNSCLPPSAALPWIASASASANMLLHPHGGTDM